MKRKERANLDARRREGSRQEAPPRITHDFTLFTALGHALLGVPHWTRQQNHAEIRTGATLELSHAPTHTPSPSSQRTLSHRVPARKLRSLTSRCPPQKDGLAGPALAQLYPQIVLVAAPEPAPGAAAESGGGGIPSTSVPRRYEIM